MSVKMIAQKNTVSSYVGVGLAAFLALAGCSRQQSDWQKTREANTADAYEQFLKKYPSGEFTAQAEARAKELYEERDWQKARDADTPEAYQAFLKQHPEGKWTEEARIRVENFTLAQAPSGSASGAESGATHENTAAVAPAQPPTAAQRPISVPPPTAVQAPTAAAPLAAAQHSAPHAVAQSGPASTAPAAKPAPKARSYGVQLGAFKSGAEAAHKHWADLQKEYPSLLSGLSSKVVPKKTADGSLYRLQATGLSEKRAHEVCGELQAKSQACVVVPPERG
jgi:cell division protein FtsN